MPVVSVIIPFYNAETYLADSLGTVCGQSLTDIEIICIDDGSTDRTYALLNEYAEKDSRIRVIHQENQGAGAARNVGLRLAKGDYLSFLDADDIYTKDMLECAYKKAVDDRAEIVIFQSDIFDNNTKTYSPNKDTIRYDLIPDFRPYAGTDVKKDVFGSIIGWAWDKLFEASFIRKTGLQFQEQRSTNDAFFVFCAYAVADRISICDRLLVHHRMNIGSSVSSTREKSWQCFYYALIAMRGFLKERNLYARFEEDYINYAVLFSMWNFQTLKEPQQEYLYNALKKEWFQELGIDTFPRDKFYHNSLYLKYLIIKMFPFRIGKCIFFAAGKWRLLFPKNRD